MPVVSSFPCLLQDNPTELDRTRAILVRAWRTYAVATLVALTIFIATVTWPLAAAAVFAFEITQTNGVTSPAIVNLVVSLGSVVPLGNRIHTFLIEMERRWREADVVFHKFTTDASGEIEMADEEQDPSERSRLLRRKHFHYINDLNTRFANE
jgi:hypothetical protein